MNVNPVASSVTTAFLEVVRGSFGRGRGRVAYPLLPDVRRSTRVVACMTGQRMIVAGWLGVEIGTSFDKPTSTSTNTMKKSTIASSSSGHSNSRPTAPNKITQSSSISSAKSSSASSSDSSSDADSSSEDDSASDSDSVSSEHLNILLAAAKKNLTEKAKGKERATDADIMLLGEEPEDK